MKNFFLFLAFAGLILRNSLFFLLIREVVTSYILKVCTHAYYHVWILNKVIDWDGITEVWVLCLVNMKKSNKYIFLKVMCHMCDKRALILLLKKMEIQARHMGKFLSNWHKIFFFCELKKIFFMPRAAIFFGPQDLCYDKQGLWTRTGHPCQQFLYIIIIIQRHKA